MARMERLVPDGHACRTDLGSFVSFYPPWCSCRVSCRFLSCLSIPKCLKLIGGLVAGEFGRVGSRKFQKVPPKFARLPFVATEFNRLAADQIERVLRKSTRMAFKSRIPVHSMFLHESPNQCPFFLSSRSRKVQFVVSLLSRTFTRFVL